MYGIGHLPPGKTQRNTTETTRDGTKLQAQMMYTIDERLGSITQLQTQMDTTEI